MSLLKIRFALKLDLSSWLRGSFARSSGAGQPARRVALLRAYDKRTGEDAGAVEMPAKQTGSPMSYPIDGKQYVVVAVSGNDGAELLAYALP